MEFHLCANNENWILKYLISFPLENQLVRRRWWRWWWSSASALFFRPRFLVVARRTTAAAATAAILTFGNNRWGGTNFQHFFHCIHFVFLLQHQHFQRFRFDLFESSNFLGSFSTILIFCLSRTFQLFFVQPFLFRLPSDLFDLLQHVILELWQCFGSFEHFFFQRSLLFIARQLNGWLLAALCGGSRVRNFSLLCSFRFLLDGSRASFGCVIECWPLLSTSSIVFIRF